MPSQTMIRILIKLGLALSLVLGLGMGWLYWEYQDQVKMATKAASELVDLKQKAESAEAQFNQILSENKELVTGLEKKVSGLETDYMEVLGLAREAEYEAAQLGDRLQEYDLDLQHQRRYLSIAADELQQARLGEQRLLQTIVKLNADKQKSEEKTATLKSRVVELLKEKDEILRKNPE